jgi:hypothetical protein
MRRRDTTSVALGFGTNGDVFYSTKPTASATAGTIRRYDPYANESQQVWQYGSKFSTAKGSITVFHADSVFVQVSSDSTRPDLVYICDHPYGRPNIQNCRQIQRFRSFVRLVRM